MKGQYTAPAGAGGGQRVGQQGWGGRCTVKKGGAAWSWAYEPGSLMKRSRTSHGVAAQPSLKGAPLQSQPEGKWERETGGRQPSSRWQPLGASASSRQVGQACQPRGHKCRGRNSRCRRAALGSHSIVSDVTEGTSRSVGWMNRVQPAAGPYVQSASLDLLISAPTPEEFGSRLTAMSNRLTSLLPAPQRGGRGTAGPGGWAMQPEGPSQPASQSIHQLRPHLEECAMLERSTPIRFLTWPLRSARSSCVVFSSVCRTRRGRGRTQAAVSSRAGDVECSPLVPPAGPPLPHPISPTPFRPEQ